jgi:hypothetical protein
LYSHHFEGAAVDTVLRELSTFRNDDGGFGNALEPDYRAPESSALATSMALEILEEIRVEREEPLVRGAVDWLSERYETGKRVWRFIPVRSTPAPQAPWWNADHLDETFAGFVVNPRAKILAHLRRYPNLVSGTWIDDLTREVTEVVEDLPDEVSVNTFLAVRDLANAENLEPDLQRRLESVLRRWIPQSVETDPTGWNGYCLKPLAVADHPTSLWTGILGRAVEANLDYEIDNQAPDGSWQPNWDWGKTGDEAWDMARREWSGILTLKNLRVFTSYGRIEEGL